MYKIEDFCILEPMKYYSNDDTSNVKRQAMIENKNGEFIGSCKKDGDWSMLIHYSGSDNLIRSRSISKVTGVYGNYTDKVPHIVEDMNWLPDNTVLLAELCWDENGTNANTVGTILRCLPKKAVERQKDKKLKAVVFDCLMINNEDLTNLAYEKRLEKAKVLLDEIKSPFIYLTDIYYDNFAEAADKIIADGGEGIVIQRKDNSYMPGTRTAWKTLKLKQQLPEMELKVVGTIEPNKDYQGDCIETWPYWEIFSGYNYCPNFETEELYPIYNLVEIGPDYDRKTISGTPVTKPYFFHWMNGITVELPDGTTTDVASGLTDDDRAWLATQDAQDMIRAGDLYAVVKAMSVNDKGSLRHPSLVRLRNDM